MDTLSIGIPLLLSSPSTASARYRGLGGAAPVLVATVKVTSRKASDRLRTINARISPILLRMAFWPEIAARKISDAGLVSRA